MAGIAQNGQKRLIFTAVPQVRTKMREKGKRENNNNNNMRMNKSKENALIYIHMYIYTHTNGHIHINALCVIQIRKCFLTLCLKVFKLFVLLIE